MKAEFLSLYHERYTRPLRDFLLAAFEPMLKVLGRFPRLFNRLLGAPASRWILKHVAGLVDLPQMGLHTVVSGFQVRKLPRFDFDSLERLTLAEKSRTLLIVQDAFITFFEPEVVLAATDLLVRLGYRPVLIPFFPNGKALHIKGFLRSFVALARRNAARLEKIASLGINLVGLEPAVTLTYRDEYPRALGVDRLPFRVLLLQEWLREQLDDIRDKLSKTRSRRKTPKSYTLLGHCTEKTASPPSQKDWQAVFSAFGLTLEIADLGCCGMCGVYGHERAHVSESRGIFELSWQPRLTLSETRGENVVIAGFSCRHQVGRFGNHHSRHPVVALLEAIDDSASASRPE